MVAMVTKKLTKVISVEVPALVASPLLLLVQSLFAVFIVFLPEVFVLQDLVGSIHLHEPVMCRGVALRHDTGVKRVQGFLCTGFIRLSVRFYLSSGCKGLWFLTGCTWVSEGTRRVVLVV